MSSNTKKLIFLVVALVLGYYAVTAILSAALGILTHLIIPLAIVGGIVFVGYQMFGRKALGGGRRTLP